MFFIQTEEVTEGTIRKSRKLETGGMMANSNHSCKRVGA